jgi:hypothetical protein
MDWSNIPASKPTKNDRKNNSNNASSSTDTRSSTNVSKSNKSKRQIIFSIQGGVETASHASATSSQSNFNKAPTYEFKSYDAALQSLKDKENKAERIDVCSQLSPECMVEKFYPNAGSHAISIRQIQVKDDSSVSLKKIVTHDGTIYIMDWLNFHLEQFLQPDRKTKGTYTETFTIDDKGYYKQTGLSHIGFSLFKHMAREHSPMQDIISAENRATYHAQAHHSEQRYLSNLKWHNPTNYYNVTVEAEDIQKCNEMAVQIIEAIVSNVTRMEFETQPPQAALHDSKNPRVTIYANTDVLPLHLRANQYKKEIGITYELQTSVFLFFCI